jgi:site-specific DNA-methyltransferase (adenine-specific)/site-specific DNA-methyltransferase (cytosine-N4-specific)
MECISCRHKQLVGIPWKLALELQRRGWNWRAEIVWSKASVPEGVKARPTRAHESVLMFTKPTRYLYNYEEMLEPHEKPVGH